MVIAVTGASGFIGAELLEVLNRREDVYVIALTRDAYSFDSYERCEWRNTDYSFDSLVKALEDADAVIHLAGVRGTENEPEKFYVNSKMTENILKAMAENEVKRIVFASSVAVYNGITEMPWKEEDPKGNYRAYGDSKLECENLIIKHSNEQDFSYGIARIAQVLGEGERRRGMMNVFIDTAREHGQLKVMGKSQAVKQYIYVKDLVNVLQMMTAEYSNGSSSLLERNMILNVGMPNAYTNLEIAQIVNEVFGNHTPIDYDDSYTETGRAFYMDTSKLQRELGCEVMDMREALTDMNNNHKTQ